MESTKINKQPENPQTLATLKQIYAGVLVFYLLVFSLKTFDLIPLIKINFAFIAIVIGIIGALIAQPNSSPVKISHWWAIASILFTLSLRIIPYINNSVPIGYDMGLYKYIFEHPVLEPEFKTIYPDLYHSGMVFITDIFGSQFVLIPLFIAITTSSVVVLYYTIKQLIDHNTAIIATVFFSISLTQYDIFTTGFYKNAIGIPLLLFLFTLFNKTTSLNFGFMIIGGILGGIHRPTLLVFGFSYLIYTVLNFGAYDLPGKTKSVINGGVVILITFLVNFREVNQYLFTGVTNFVSSLTSPGTAGGFYITFPEYLQQSSALIIFAIPGLFLFWKKYKPINIATITLLIMIIARLYFFKRFIIFLDVFIVIYAALGFIALINSVKNIFFRSAMIMTILLGALQIFGKAVHLEPEVSNVELNSISKLDEYLEQDATVVLTDSNYGPWFKGWTKIKFITPGMFQDPFSYEQWELIWYGTEGEKSELLSTLEPPVYFYIGDRTKGLNLDFEKCFIPVSVPGIQIYEFICK